MEQILLIGKTRDPYEACGIVTPDSQVVELDNHAVSPCSSYELLSDELVGAMDEFVNRTKTPWSDLTQEHFIIWHTHPGGNIGPSRADLKHRLEGFQYVVVSLPNGEAVRF